MISFIVDNPRKTLFIIFSLTVGFAYYAFFSSNKIIVDFSLEQMFPENDIERDKYDAFREEFSREDDKFLLVYGCDDPLSRESIEKIYKINKNIKAIRGIENTTCLATIEGIDDEEYLFDLDIDDSTWASNRDMILNHPLYTDLVISKDGKSGGIYIDLEDDVDSQFKREMIFDEIDRIIELRGKEWEWHEAGIPVLRTRYVELVSQERAIFIPLGCFVVVLILFFIFRQVNCVLLPMTSIFITLIWVSALMAFCGISINLISYLTYILILIIGCSNCIHILMKYHECISEEGVDIKDAVKRIIKELGFALFLTSFTTAIGFFSLMMTNIKITQEFGFVLGVGIIMMFMIAIITIPIILLYMPRPSKHHIKRLIHQKDSFSVDKIDIYIKRSPYLILFISVAFLVFSVMGLRKIDYNISILDDLSPGNRLYDDIMYVDQNFGGTLPLEIVINNKGENIFDMNFINKVEKFEHKIESMSDVKKAISLNDYVKLIHPYFNPESESVFPETGDEIADYLDYGIPDNLYSSDETKYRITCRVGNIRSKVADSLKIKIESAFEDIFYSKIAHFEFVHNGCVEEISGGKAKSNGFSIDPTVNGYSFSNGLIPEGKGTLVKFEGQVDQNCLSDFMFTSLNGDTLSYEFAEMSSTDEEAKCLGGADVCLSFSGKRLKYDSSKKSQDVLVSGSTLLALRTQGFLVRDLTYSFVLAFGIIFFSMIILFRSIRLSLISILPNIIPLMAAAAIMGYAGIKLRPSTAMTFSIALGIAVDDTIHFLARFRQELTRTKDVAIAITNSILSTGKAIIGTTLVLCMGFFVLYFSELVPNHEFGILATIILLIALAGSLLLLPVLLNLFYKYKAK